MIDYANCAERLKKHLALAQEPVAVAFCDEVAANIPEFDDVVPAGCSFWERATRSCFSTAASDHALCAIGVHTHNLAQPAGDQQGELATTIETMVKLDYVKDNEVARIPTMAKPSRHVVYGPLAGLPKDLDVDVVLFFAAGRQSLVVSEAVARVDAALPSAMGRPACAVIPLVANQGAAAMSLGCCGARAYLDNLDDTLALWALPAQKLDQYCDAIESLAGANDILTQFHTKRRAEVANGERPSVQDTLNSIS